MFRRPTYNPVKLRDMDLAPMKLGRPGVYADCGELGLAVPKECVLSSEAYRNVVRAMPCIRCGWPPRSQFCHADFGKGMGIKTDDRRGWPGCGPHGNEPGCHWIVGTSGRIPRDQRREIEAEYARLTRIEVLRLGLWPKNLPMWEEA